MNARQLPESHDLPSAVAAEAAGAGASALWARMVNESPVGIAVIGPDGGYHSVNPAYARMYGYSQADMPGRPFTIVVQQADRPHVLARHQTFIAEGGEMRGERRVVRRDGTTFDVLVESVRLLSPDGQASRLVYVIDITARRQAELALRRAERFASSVLDDLSALVGVLDEAGTVVNVNRAWRDFQQAHPEVPGFAPLGGNYRAACLGMSPVPAAGNGGLADALGEVLQGRLAKLGFEHACTAGGQQRWFLTHVSRIEGSEPPRVVVAHDDITAVRLAGEQVGRSEALLRELAASIPGALFRLELVPPAEWRFTYLSPGVLALYGVSPERACNDRKVLLNSVLAEDRPGHDVSVLEAFASRGPWEHEYRIRSADGTVKWIHAKATPKPGEGGSVVWTGMLTDVSERKRMDAVLQASEATYRTLFETVPQGIVYHDRAGRITAANPAAQRILGLTLDQLQGRTPIDPLWQAVHEDGSPFPGEQHPAAVTLATAQPVRDVVMGLQVPGRGTVWLLVDATPLFEGGALQSVYASFEDITQRVQLSNELRRQASTDELTGAANRRSLIARLQQEFDRFRRHPEMRCSVLAMDLDHFKRINDSFGHAAGDALLAHVAQLMRQQVRLVDLLGRSGGEEFLLLLPDTDLDAAAVLAERLRERVASSRLDHAGISLTITVSVGVAVMRAGDTSADDVLARADRALYEAKSGGRNTVRCAPPG